MSRISAKPIVNFANINQFSFGNQWAIRAGDPNTLYFQLIDLDQNELRYLVGVSQVSGITVTFPSIDDSLVINATAVQDTNDKSVWAVTLAPNQLPGSGNVKFAVVEGSNTRRFNVLNMLSVEIVNDGGC